MEIAETLAELHKNPYVQILTDRTQPIDNILEDILSWRHNTFYDRHPSSAFSSSGEFRGTDLDLFTFLAELDNRNAVINISDYEARRPVTYHLDEILESEENRHGQIISLNGNENVFSFSVKIFDQNVINKETGEPGGFRSFLITNLNGELYEGWSKWSADLVEKEDKFLRPRGTFSGEDRNTLEFKYSVHPNAWQSPYGAPFSIRQIAIKRFIDEAKFYRKIDSIYWDAGIRLERTKGNRFDKNFERPSRTQRGPGRKVRVPTLEFDIDFPMYGKYPAVPATSEGRTYAKERSDWLSYSILSRIRFATQAAAYAFYEYNGFDKRPGWPVPDWQEDVLSPGKKTKMNVMDFGNSIRLGYRHRVATETVR